MEKTLKIQAHLEHLQIKGGLEKIINSFADRLNRDEIQVMLEIARQHGVIAEAIKGDVRGTPPKDAPNQMTYEPDVNYG